MSYDVAAVTHELTALIRERRLDPYARVGRVYLMDFASGAAELPITNASIMRQLANLLRVERRWLYSLCGVQLPTPSPRIIERKEAVVVGEEAATKKKPRRQDQNGITICGKWFAPEAPAAPKPPNRITCDTCHIVRPVSDFHVKTSASTCRLCVSDAKAARRAERRKAIYAEKKRQKQMRRYLEAGASIGSK